MKLNTKTIIWVVVIILLLSSTSIIAENIINPVICYNIMSVNRMNGAIDSTLRGQVFFDPLPEYLNETCVILEYYSQLDTKYGYKFKYRSRHDGSISAREYIKSVPGPIKSGETIQIEFFITPQRVGFIELSFSVSENCSDYNIPEDYKCAKGGSILSANILLAPDGNTYALGSEACNYWNGTLLGPYPELFKKGVKFFVDPKPVSYEYSASTIEYYNKVYVHMRNFAIEAIVTPEIDLGFIQIDFKVSPYHNFAKGFGFQINYSGNIDILEIPPCISQPLDSSQTYNLTLKTSLPKHGFSNLIMGFHTRDPKTYGLEENRYRDKVGTSLNLTIGTNENGEILFIGEYRLVHSLKSKLNELGSSYFDLDKRYTIVSNFDRPPAGGNKKSEGFDELISGIKKKKINNNRRARNR